jgi:microcystin-dependent protein
MGLETATFISSLVATNPVAGDTKSQGDDHFRLVKSVLQATFPTASKAFYFPTAGAKSADFTILAAEERKTFYVDTSGAGVTGTLPTLAAGDAGWECYFIKTNTGTNAFFVAPPSGTLTSGEVSGLAKCRRVIPGHRCTAVWTGVAWFVTRNCNAPIGTTLEFCGTTLPTGFEWPNGQTLSSAANYPEFNSVRGSVVTPNQRGRVVAGKDDMGGVSANNLTGLSGGLNGDTFEAVGGSETHTLTLAQLASHNHGGNTGTAGAHTHTTTISPLAVNENVNGTDIPGASGGDLGSHGYLSDSQGDHQHTIPSAGSDTAHNNVQPTIIENKILVVE